MQQLGTYTVMSTDTATGCFADGTIVQSQQTIAITNTTTNFNCNNDNSQITVSVLRNNGLRLCSSTSNPCNGTIYFASSNVVTDTNGTILNWGLRT
jgi:hypothetical protein